MTHDGLEDGLSRLHSRIKDLYKLAGKPALRQLEEHAELGGFKLSHSTAQELLAARRMPRWATVEAFVQACLAYVQGRRTTAAIPASMCDLGAWRHLYDAADGTHDGEAKASTRGTSLPTRRRHGERSSLAQVVETDAVLWDVCVAFLLSLDSGQSELRNVAKAKMEPTEEYSAANRAMHEARVYAERERLLITGTPELIRAGEAVFLKLVAIRNAVRTGAGLDSEAYHRTYHPFADAMWRFRLAVRVEFGKSPLTPEELDRANWLDHERCVDCPASPEAPSSSNADKA